MSLPILDQPTPCRNKSDLFLSTDPDRHVEAAAICNTVCTQKVQCWDLMLSDRKSGGIPTGTWLKGGDVEEVAA